MFAIVSHCRRKGNRRKEREKCRGPDRERGERACGCCCWVSSSDSRLAGWCCWCRSCWRRACPRCRGLSRCPVPPPRSARRGRSPTSSLCYRAPETAGSAPDPLTARGRLRTWLGLEPNILVLLGTILILGMGEELWIRFVPKYLELLGAGAWGIAAYGTLKDLLDAVYQYPGGWIADRLGGP